MSQVTTGIRSLLSSPFMYDALQRILGGDKARQLACRDYLQLQAGDCVVDIGCGTATLLRHLPEDIEYYGFDLSEEYIEAARKHHGARGEFHCKDITTLEDGDIRPCRYAIAMGVLHHLDDDVAKRLIDKVYDRLAPGGKLITLDPVYVPGQSKMAYEVIRRDRGQNVRTPEGYSALVSKRYGDVTVDIRHDYFHIPYTLAIMVAAKSQV